MSEGKELGKGESLEWLDYEEFYELMQSYRFANPTDQRYVAIQFEAVKDFIRKNVYQLIEKPEPRVDKLIKELEDLEKLRFVGDKLDQFEHLYHNQLDFKQSKTLNIIYKEIWEYASRISKLRKSIEETGVEIIGEKEEK